MADEHGRRKEDRDDDVVGTRTGATGGEILGAVDGKKEGSVDDGYDGLIQPEGQLPRDFPGSEPETPNDSVSGGGGSDKMLVDHFYRNLIVFLMILCVGLGVGLCLLAFELRQLFSPAVVVNPNGVASRDAQIVELEEMVSAKDVEIVWLNDLVDDIRLGFAEEMATTEAEKMSLEGRIETLEELLRRLKDKHDAYFVAMGRKRVDREGVLQGQYNARAERTEEAYKNEVASLNSEASSLVGQIEDLREKLDDLVVAQSEILRQRNAEHSARMKAKDEALRKAIKGMSRAEVRAKMAESGLVFSVSRMMFPPKEKIGIKAVSPLGGAPCGKECVELFTNKVVDGHPLSVRCEVTKEDACRLRRTGVWVGFDESDIVVTMGETSMHCGRVYRRVRYLNPIFDWES